MYPSGGVDIEYPFHGLKFVVPTTVMSRDKLVFALVFSLNFLTITGMDIDVKGQSYCIHGVKHPFQPGKCAYR